MRVVVADDHAVARVGIRIALELDGIEVCAEAPDAPAAVEAVVVSRPDVAVLDLHMPGGGLAAARRIAAEAPETAVVILTVADSDEDLLAAARVGVAGFLRKDMNLDRLGDTLRGVVRGEAAFSRTAVARLLDEFQDRSRTARRSVPGRPAVQLTSREAEVAELLRGKLTTAEMARRLYVSPATIRTHVASVLRKFGVADRAALVALVGRGETSTLD